jgi:PAS domain S-box-containing protein
MDGLDGLDGLDQSTAHIHRDLKPPSTSDDEDSDQVFQSPVAAYICDNSGNITDYNEAATVIWGGRPQADKDKWWCYSFSSEASDSSLEYGEQAAALASKTQKVVVKEILIKNAGHQSMLLKVCSVPLTDANGHVTRVISTLVPAAKKKKQNESEEQLRMAIIATKLGVWNYNLISGELHWSDECRAIFGVPKDLVISFDFFQNSIHEDDRADILQAIKTALNSPENNKYDKTYRIIRQNDGAIRWIRSQATTFFNTEGKIQKFIGSVLDITDQKSRMEDLENTVNARIKDLEIANANLAASNKDLERFAFVASHDLQEPLRKIATFADTLVTRHQALFDDEARDLIERMRQAASRMKGFINNLLSYSSVARVDDFVMVDLNEIIEEILADLELSIREKRAQIYQESLPRVLGSPFQLRQLFQNLISNGLKFCKPGQVPEIFIASRKVPGSDIGPDIKPEDTTKSFYEITVADNGIGFEPEHSLAIFKMFQRLHAHAEYPGSGIGLSIVKRVADNHNGYVHAESSSGNGAKFFFFVPAPEN